MNLKYVEHNAVGQRVDTWDNELRFVVKVEKSVPGMYPVKVIAAVMKDWKGGHRATSAFLVGDSAYGPDGLIAEQYFQTKKEADIWITAFAGAYEVTEDRHLAARIANAATTRF